MGKKKAYIRCNSGHYFSGSSNCPLDNWSSRESEELTNAIETVNRIGHELSVEAIQKQGVSDTAIERLIVIEFGSEDSSFMGIVPEGYIMEGGKYVSILGIGRHFK